MKKSKFVILIMLVAISLMVLPACSGTKSGDKPDTIRVAA